MSIDNGNYVKSSGITRQQFEQQLDQQKVKGERKAKALSIFDKYAGISADSAVDVMDETEQARAREEFAKLDGDDKNEDVSKKEFKSNVGNTEQLKTVDGADYKSYKSFIEVMNSLTESATDQERNVVLTDNGSTVIVDGASTEPVNDDRVVELDTAPTPEPPKSEPVFKDLNDVQSALYKYITGNNELSAEDIQQLKSMNFLDGITFTPIADGGADQAEVIYNGMTFAVRKGSNGELSIDSKPAEGQTEGVTLQQAILDSQTTDVKHNYLNKYGKAGNSKSSYDASQGNINNTSVNRQHVNPVQTLMSMILNNTEDSTLTIRNGLDGQAVIDEIKGTSGDKDGISMSELFRYIRASIAEAAKTTADKKNFGTRTAASDVDFDLKDFNNISIVFKHYDEDGSGKLDDSELDKLIADLTSGKTMTGIAKASNKKYKYNKPDGDVRPVKPAPAPLTKPEPKLGRELDPNRTRNDALNGEKLDYLYHDGRRTYVKDGKEVTNAGLVERLDHGIGGAGKKDFIVVYGLGPDIDAEVIDDKKHVASDHKIKVKNNKGNVSYYNVQYDSATKTFRLGTNLMLSDLFGNDADSNMKIPNGLTMDYKDGRATYKFNGRKINKDVARARIIAENAAKPLPKVSLKPTDDGVDYAGLSMNEWREMAKNAKAPADKENLINKYIELYGGKKEDVAKALGIAPPEQR